MAGAVRPKGYADERPKGYADEFLNTLYDDACIKTWAKVFLGAQAPVCPSCGPGRCDGSTQDCTLDSYYANPANGSRPAAAGGTAQNPAPAGPCPGCHTSPCKGGFSQCSAFGYGWLGPFYPATQYDDSPPTERLPAAAPKCECGSGDSARSGAHSHWCPCWVAP